MRSGAAPEATNPASAKEGRAFVSVVVAVCIVETWVRSFRESQTAPSRFLWWTTIL